MIEAQANQQRAHRVTSRATYDFDAGVVRDLRLRHRQALEEDGFIYTLADRYSNSHHPSEAILVDEATSYHVCLAPKLGGYDRSDPSSVEAENAFFRDEVFVTVALQGDFFMDKGVPVRRKSDYIIIGHLDEDSPGKRYVPDTSLVTQAQFDRILGLTRELQQLKATSQPRLDTEMVALKKA